MGVNGGLVGASKGATVVGEATVLAAVGIAVTAGFGLGTMH